MSPAQNGHVRLHVSDPVPEMALRPMELPQGERERALEGLNIALAQRHPTRPALTPELAQAIHAAYLRGWADCRWNVLRVRAAEARAARDGVARKLDETVEVRGER